MNTEMIPWYDIYKERMNDKYFKHIRYKYAEFIDELVSQKSDRYVELGCGAGNISKAIAERLPNSKLLIIDNCEKMLKLAEENVPKGISFTLDIFSMDTHWAYLREEGSIVHSHGVLEHYSDSKIRNLLRFQSHCTQIHYVPGKKYKTPSRGDERLLSVSEWRNIIAPTKLDFKITTFNAGYDFIIKVKPKK